MMSRTERVCECVCACVCVYIIYIADKPWAVEYRTVYDPVFHRKVQSIFIYLRYIFHYYDFEGVELPIIYTIYLRHTIIDW